MSGQQNESDATKKWVQSPRKAIYVRDPKASFWRGPRDDRVFVPSLDWPVGLEPPPDDMEEEQGASSATAAPAATSANPAPAFGSLPAFNYVAPPAHPPANPFSSTVSAPAYRTTNQPTSQPPITQPGPPANASGEWQVVGRRSPPRHHPQAPPPYYRGYSGPFAHTMRHRDAGLRQQESRRESQGGPVTYGSARYQARPDADARGPPRYYDREEREDRGDRHRSDSTRYRGDPRNEYADHLGRGNWREENRAETQEFQGRARDQAVRDRSTSSRPSSNPERAPGFVPEPAPVVEDAPRRENGHPIFPEDAVPDDESDYGDSEDDSEAEERNRKSRRHRELRRLTEAMQRAGTTTQAAVAPPNYRPSVGLWGTLGFGSIAETRNLIRWMSGGCPKARAMYLYLRQHYENTPTAPRSDGILYLFHQQNSAESAWLMRTTGDATPLVRRLNRKPHKSRNARRRDTKLKKKGGPSTTTQAHFQQEEEMEDVVNAEIAQALSGEGDVNMGAAPEDTTTYNSFVGESRAPTDYDEGPVDESRPRISPPDTSLADAMTALTSQRPMTWDDGIRLADGQWPDANSPIGSVPMVNDVISARFMHFIAPRDDTAERVEFMNTAYTMLSVMGLYERLVHRGAWQYARLPLEHFPFQGPLTPSQVLAWIYQHGVAPQSAALQSLRAFAISWRNLREGNLSPTGTEFRDAPRTVMDALSWPDSRITEWRLLQYGRVIEGVTTNYPQRPSGGLREGNPGVEREEGEIPHPDDTEMPPAATDEESANAGPATEAASVPIPTSPTDEVLDYGDGDHDASLGA
ncbi:hypothetical protein B0H11DRAFT_1908767 [Mycena galericulata]|nr:hypothetical protein B0H11DRAFT_1908767 [Mycena galericulata]